MSWWEAPERLDDDELRAMIRAATSVLARRGDVRRDDLAQMPQSVAVAELRGALESEGLALAPEDTIALAEPTLERRVAEAVLSELGRDAQLRAAIEGARRASDELMVLDPGTLGVVALVLLSVKVRRIRVTRDGVDVAFDPVKQGVVSSLTKILRQ
jgi:hypothetical protein